MPIGIFYVKCRVDSSNHETKGLINLTLLKVEIAS